MHLNAFRQQLSSTLVISMFDARADIYEILWIYIDLGISITKHFSFFEVLILMMLQWNRDWFLFIVAWWSELYLLLSIVQSKNNDCYRVMNNPSGIVTICCALLISKHDQLKDSHWYCYITMVKFHLAITMGSSWLWL